MEKKIVKAYAKNVRLAAEKVRRTLALIRGKNAQEALMILKYTPNRPSEAVYKVLASAIANAEHNFGLDMDKLIVFTAQADQGPFMRRFRPVSKGSAHPFRHHTCHITVTVCEQ